MSEEDEVVAILENELGVSFVFEEIDKVTEHCLEVLEEAKQSVFYVTDLQKRNFHVQKDAITKYREEHNLTLCKQERLLLGRTVELNNKAEVLKKEINQIDSHWKETQEKLTKQLDLAQELEQQKTNLLSEKDKVVEELEQMRRAYDLSLALYQLHLGIQISAESDSKRYIITFRKVGGKILRHAHKIIIDKSNDSFLLSDGTTLESSAKLMARLCQERRRLTA